MRSRNTDGKSNVSRKTRDFRRSLREDREFFGQKTQPLQDTAALRQDTAALKIRARHINVAGRDEASVVHRETVQERKRRKVAAVGSGLADETDGFAFPTAAGELNQIFSR